MISGSVKVLVLCMNLKQLQGPLIYLLILAVPVDKSSMSTVACVVKILIWLTCVSFLFNYCFQDPHATTENASAAKPFGPSAHSDQIYLITWSPCYLSP